MPVPTDTSQTKSAKKKKPVTFKQKIEAYKKLVKAKKGKVSIKQVAKIMGKKPERIKLKNGKSIYGVIYQRGSGYVIFTTRGKVHIKTEDLAEIRF